MSPPASYLAWGFVLIAATLTGVLFERLRLPRVTGYLVFGIVSGPYAAGLITRPMAAELGVVNGIAIALIALTAGLQLNYRRLKPRLASLWLVWPWLPIYPDATAVPRLALTFLITTIVVSFSPTVTIAVIADTR